MLQPATEYSTSKLPAIWPINILLYYTARDFARTGQPFGLAVSWNPTYCTGKILWRFFNFDFFEVITKTFPNKLSLRTWLKCKLILHENLQISYGKGVGQNVHTCSLRFINQIFSISNSCLWSTQVFFRKCGLWVVYFVTTLTLVIYLWGLCGE